MNVDLTSQVSSKENDYLRLAPEQTVASLARPTTPLSLNTSVPRAIEALRQSNLERYPVCSGTRLVALLSEDDLSSVLLHLTPDQQEFYRLLPLTAIVETLLPYRVAPPTIAMSEPVSNAFRFFEEHPDETVIAVMDGSGGYFGILSRMDLLAGCFRTLAPPKVGGMATPLGVYLTDGVDSGGVGNVALVLAGASMTLLFMIAIGLFTWVQNFALLHHVDLYGDAIALLTPVMPHYAASFVDDVQVVIPLVLMMALLRAVPVAGYHAAEHQVVHCIERGEPLVPAKVASMPRPHPRCGTNLVAAMSLFGFCFSVFAGIWSYSNAIIPAAVVTLLTWRRVGTFLQQYFTTRKASSKQLASGIKAGEDLLKKFRQNTNRTAKLPLRLWRMGLLQMLAGCAIMGFLLLLASRFIPALTPLVQSMN